MVYYLFEIYYFVFCYCDQLCIVSFVMVRGGVGWCLDGVVWFCVGIVIIYSKKGV